MQAIFSAVWVFKRWIDLPRPELQGQNLGIDLLTSRRPEHGGGLMTVQSKCFAANARLMHKDIVSFSTETKTHGCEKILFVDTTEIEASVMSAQEKSNGVDEE